MRVRRVQMSRALITFTAAEIGWWDQIRFLDNEKSYGRFGRSMRIPKR
jgi:hypothetical protein